MKKKLTRYIFSVVILFSFSISQLKAQSPMNGATKKKVYFNNSNAEEIFYAYSFDKLHWTKTSISDNSKKDLDMQSNTECYIRVYTNSKYELFIVERGKKYVFIKNDDNKWEIQEVSLDGRD